MLKYQYIHIWSERKVLNKYFPPDFDPSKIPRRKVVKELQQKVRLMAPFSMQCSTCGDYIYKGKKFNARKERSEGEKYLNIQIYRFYIRCPKCAAEITFKTDPRNTDYVAEHGAVRNFEPWRDQSTTQDAMDSEKAIEEENNPMRALENRTIESKREMDILDALDEIRTKNAHLERIISVNQTEIQANSAEDLAQKLQALQDDEDSKLASSIFQTVDGESVRRIDDDVDLHDLISQSEVAATTSFDIPEQQFKVPKPITSSQSLINSNPSVIGKRKQICTPNRSRNQSSKKNS
ncbi:hypothetical protein BASA62_002136 [Batrachochytrium salamandrivorans]|nr:hypothetical protein BASA62_002136 [Batrachochytrium salamandrivorans]